LGAALGLFMFYILSLALLFLPPRKWKRCRRRYLQGHQEGPEDIPEKTFRYTVERKAKSPYRKLVVILDFTYVVHDTPKPMNIPFEGQIVINVIVMAPKEYRTQ
jgi:hypothetical protein